MTILKSSLLQNAGFDHGFGTALSGHGDYPPDVHVLKQIHGERIVVLTAGGGRRKEEGGRDFQDLEIRFRDLPADPFRFEEGDALVTDIPGVSLGIRTADCLPILLADTATGAVAAVHCGWRSLALGLAGKASLALLALSESDPSRLFAVLGPCIGPCCYQVGEEVRKAFTGPHPGSDASFEVRQARIFMNLASAARAQLAGIGLSPANLETVPGCTSCDHNLFWSFRRGDEEDRMVSFIEARGPSTP